MAQSYSDADTIKCREEGPNYSETSLFEFAFRSASENTMSAGIAWLLGGHSGLDTESRRGILSALTGKDESRATDITIETEWRPEPVKKGKAKDQKELNLPGRLDLWLSWFHEGEKRHLAIENKIKASEGFNQLARYDDLINACPTIGNVRRKLFLTLNGRKSVWSKEWSAVSYKDLLNAFHRFVPEWRAIPEVRSFFLAVERLTGVVDAVENDEDVAAWVFGEKNHGDFAENDLVRYVTRMKLEKILQRVWLERLAAQVQAPANWRSVTGTSQNEGQITLNIGGGLFGLDETWFGVQIQNRTIKLFSEPHWYEDGQPASPKQKQNVDETIERIRGTFNDGTWGAPSRARNRYFRSVSKKHGGMPEGRSLSEWASEISSVLQRLSLPPFTLCEPVPRSAQPS